MKNIKNVYITTYDGFIICSHKNDSNIEAYEGKAMCPKTLQKWLEINKPIELDMFYTEAISYGYCT